MIRYTVLPDLHPRLPEPESQGPATDPPASHWEGREAGTPR